MKRILHYVGKMDIGGMESIIMSLYRTIDRNEWQFDFAVHTKEKGYFDDEIISMGGRIYHFPPMRKNPLRYKRKWNDFWESHKEEYYAFQMHTNSLANILALKSAYKAKVYKRIVHAHSSYSDKGKLQLLNNVLHKIHRAELKWLATTEIACSGEAGAWMFGNSNRMHILNNGVDYEKYRYTEVKRNGFRNELGIHNEIVLCQIGHMLPVKNHHFSLELISSLINTGMDVRLIFAGSGELQEDLKQYVNDNGLSDYVLFLGQRTDIDRVLAGADIFLMPSLYEGMPLSSIEAQVSGIQCLLSDTITKEISISNRCIFLSINRMSDWVEKIRQYKPNERIDFRLDNRFNIMNVTEKYAQIISE